MRAFSSRGPVIESILGISALQLGLVLLVTCAAAMLRAFTGFGFALAAVPVYALFLAPPQVVSLCAALVCLLGAHTFRQYAGHIDAQREWPLFVAAIPGSVLGATLLSQADQDQFRLSLGVLTIVASLVLARFKPHPRPANPGLQAGTGLACGVLGGAFAVPGPPLIVMVMATESDPARSRALMIGFFSFAAVLGLVNYAFLGYVSLQTLWLALAAYPAMYLGDRAGTRLFLQYGGAQYRPIAIATCLLIGVAITLRAIF